MSSFLVSPVLGGPQPPPLLVVRDTGSLVSGGTSATKTLAGMFIGSASSDRYVIAALDTAAALTVSSVTIGGVAASLIYAPSAALVFYGALVPTGSTATVTLVQTATSPAANGWGCILFSLTGYQSSTPVLTDTDVLIGTTGVPVVYSHLFSSIPDDAAVLAVMAGAGGASTTSGTFTISSTTPSGFSSVAQSPGGQAFGEAGVATSSLIGSLTVEGTSGWSGTATSAPSIRSAILCFR